MSGRNDKFRGIGRRDFMALLGGATAAWPGMSSAEPQRMRRIGVLMTLAADDPQSPLRLAVLHQGLQELGWTVGRNVHIDYRWTSGETDPTTRRRYAAELLALAPDAILANGAASVAALQQESRSVPIVFVNVADPVGGGYVANLARPGGNATGFALPEYSYSGKYLELLKQIAPAVMRAAVLRNPADPAGTGQLGAIQAVASSVGVELTPIDVRDLSEMERAVALFAGRGNGGLVVPGSASVIVHRKLIIALAAQHRLPAAYSSRYFITDGGLISYGPDSIEPYRRAAGYVDRILKGEKPADLPVQAPTKYETVLNLKTAKALGLQVPDVVRLRADEVIE